jgi:hypothetical protein
MLLILCLNDRDLAVGASMRVQQGTASLVVGGGGRRGHIAAQQVAARPLQWRKGCGIAQLPESGIQIDVCWCSNSGRVHSSALG